MLVLPWRRCLVVMGGSLWAGEWGVLYRGAARRARSSSSVRAARWVSPGPSSRTVMRGTLSACEGGVMDGEEALRDARRDAPGTPADPGLQCRSELLGAAGGEERVV